MKKFTATLLAVFMLLSLCACGAAKSESPAAEPNYNYKTENSAVTYDSAAVAAEEYGGFSAALDSSAATGATDDSTVPEEDPSKIIYSADATVETTEFEDTCTAVLKMVDKYGGWIESSNVSSTNYYSMSRGTSDNRSASYRLRIPSAKFSTVMGELSNLGNIPYSHTYSENVSAQYYDLEARLKACQTQEARLLEMIGKAETVKEIITIEDRLTELRYQIESIQSTLKGWDRQVSYSTISLSVEEVQEYTPGEEESYWQELGQGMKEGLESALDIIKGLLLFIVNALPVLIVLGAVGLGLFFLIRKIVRWRKAGTVKKPAATQPEEEKK